MDYRDFSHRNWYLIRTKPNKEEVVVLHLSRLSIDTYNPKIRERKRYSGSFDYVMKPLFPGYIFARFSITEHYRLIKFTRGVVDIVSFGGVPAVVEDTLIGTIKAKEKDGAIQLSEKRWRKGEILEIVDGPFRGLTGLFERYLDGYQRVELLINCLRYSMRVNIRKEYVRPVVNRGATL